MMLHDSELQRKTLEVLSRHHAVITDTHVVFKSGKHGNAYVNKDAIYPHTKDTSQLCWYLALKFANENVEVVIAPAVGGVILSQWVAFHLSQISGKEVLALYADKEGEDLFVIKRGYDKLIKGKRVLVIEDVVNTGKSVRLVVEAVRKTGGEVVHVGVLVNRGGVTAQDIGNVPDLFALADVKLDSYGAGTCPLCHDKVQVNTDVGKGREFLAGRQPA